jgi:hypothetical protein
MHQRVVDLKHHSLQILENQIHVYRITILHNYMLIYYGVPFIIQCM